VEGKIFFGINSFFKMFNLTRCFFKNCWSVGVGGGVGWIEIVDFRPKDCIFINCSIGNRSETHPSSGGFMLIAHLIFYVIFFFFFKILIGSFFLSKTTDYTIKNCSFIEGFSIHCAGALCVHTITLKVISCLFDRCAIGTGGTINNIGYGGAIQTHGSLIVKSSTFSGCVSNAYGGGAISFDGNESKLEILYIENTAFLFCESRGLSSSIADDNPYVGGAIRFYSLEFICKNTSFLNCRSRTCGGAIGFYNNSCSPNTMRLEGCVLASNFAEDGGGAIFVRKIALSCTNCSFLHNRATKYGSAVAHNISNSVEYTNCIFLRNIISCCDEGGGSASFHTCQKENSTISLSQIVFFENVFSEECESMAF
jgi:hypothetical protein